jgi:hypothetical protein
MELQTLFKRESVADPLSKTYANSPLPSKNNGGAHSVPGCGDLEFGSLGNRFQRTCRFKDGVVTTSQKKSHPSLLRLICTYCISGVPHKSTSQYLNSPLHNTPGTGTVPSSGTNPSGLF